MITRKVTTADLIGIDDQSTKNQVTITDTGVGISSASTGAKLFIDQDTGKIALDIDSEATSATVLRIDTPKTTTGNVIDVANADSLTTGRITNFQSNSSNTSGRELVFIQNTNTLATGTTTLFVRQNAANQVMVLDQNAASSYIDYQGTAAANATDPISTLTTSGATTNHIQIEINGVKAWIAVSTTDPS